MQREPDTGLAANEFEITDAEREALGTKDGAGDEAAGQGDAVNGQGTGVPPATATGTPPEVPVGEQPIPAAADDAGGAEGQPDPTAAADTPAAAGATTQAPDPRPSAPFVPQYTAADSARNFDEEIKGVNDQLIALKTAYKKGDIEDDDAYEAQYEALRDQRGQIERAKDHFVLKQQLSQENADQSWQYVQRQFLSDPANAALASNDLLFAAWEQGMQQAADEAAKEGRQLTDWDLLVGGRQKLVEAGMMPQASNQPPPTTTVQPPPKPDRTPPLTQVPATLGGAPAAADPASRSTADAAAGMDDIEELEAMLAGKSEAERDRLLRDVPGSFAD